MHVHFFMTRLPSCGCSYCMCLKEGVEGTCYGIEMLEGATSFDPADFYCDGRVVSSYALSNEICAK